MTPPTIGEFQNGRGEFYSQEDLDGRAIFVRFVISDITPNSCHFEQAFSSRWGQDMGSELDRHRYEGEPMNGERQFDFLQGDWDALCRVPSKDGWEEAAGRLTASRTLDGLVSIEHFEGIYHGGALKGLGLRAFNRETQEWEHTWTDTLSPGNFHVWKGAFRDGKIDLFGEWIEADGRTVLLAAHVVGHPRGQRALGELTILRRRKNMGNSLGHRHPTAAAERTRLDYPSSGS